MKRRDDKQEIVVSVILPTYNEKENVKRVIPLIEEVFKREKIKGEILVVDDSSPDGTAKATLELNNKLKNVRLILRKKKEGMGAAINEGLCKGKGRYLISFDIDSIDPKIIPEFLNLMQRECDVVAGSRYLHGSLYEKKKIKTYIKNLISNIGNKMTTVILRAPISDFSLNCRGIKKECWQKLHCSEKGNAWMLEMIYLAYKQNFKIKELPVEFKDRIYGKSKLSFLKQVPRYFMKIIILRLKR